VAEAGAAAAELVAHREWLVEALAPVPGVQVAGPAAAPFLLLRVPDGPAVRARLRAAGIAVRRADTFPGLTRDHLRVAVRPPEQARLLVAALAAALTAPPAGPPAAPPAAGRTVRATATAAHYGSGMPRGERQ
jgi:histidinol-phosphate aminotransferase